MALELREPSTSNLRTKNVIGGKTYEALMSLSKVRQRNNIFNISFVTNITLEAEVDSLTDQPPMH